MDNSKKIIRAVETIKNGGIILYPTETVIGLGCLATNKFAIEKLNKIKSRPKDKSFIVLVNSLKMILNFCPKINQKEVDLLNQSIPTTVIVNKVKNLPKKLLFKDGSLAFRITKHPVINSLIRSINQPIVSTSANISGEPTIKSLKNVNPVVLEQVDYTLNLQSDFISTQQPSQIVKVVNGVIIYIRR